MHCKRQFVSRTNRAIQPSFSMKILLTNHVKFLLIQDFICWQKYEFS